MNAGIPFDWSRACSQSICVELEPIGSISYWRVPSANESNDIYNNMHASSSNWWMDLCSCLQLDQFAQCSWPSCNVCNVPFTNCAWLWLVWFWHKNNSRNQRAESERINVQLNEIHSGLFADKECHELGDPDKGKVILTGRLFADRAIYTCDEGYRLVGVEFRLCQADGSWSATEPSCHKNGNGSPMPSLFYLYSQL